jgi:hypothetical protein
MFPLFRRLFCCAALVFLASAGAGPLYAQATLTPPTQDFGSIVVSQSSSPIVFTFTNTSLVSEQVSSITASNSPVSDFTVSGGNCNSAVNGVAAGNSCTINIVFTPAATGPASSTMTVTYTPAGGASQMATASLTGTGIPSTTTSTLTPSSATFNSTVIGNTSPSVQFVLTNTGNTTIGDILFSVTTGFSATPLCGAQPVTLAPGASCDINVSFSPTTAGSNTGKLTVQSTSSSSPLTASLTGTGISNLSGLTLSTDALSFSGTEIGATSSPSTVTLTNNDPGTITFTAPHGANGDAFPVSGNFNATNTCAQTLAAGASCQAIIAFAPTTTGILTGSLTVNSTASNGTQTLLLSGNGTDYTLATTTPSVTVVQGSTATYSIQLTPVSGYSNTISLSCTGLNAVGTSCSTPTATLGPAATVNFTITTTPKNLFGVIGNGFAPTTTRATWFVALCSLLLLALAARPRRLARAAGLLALLLTLLMPSSGCSGKQPTPDPDATQPGTYTFTLNAIDSAQRNKTLSLTLVVTSQ